MNKIASFTVNHNVLTEGLYLSRTDGERGDIVTYDIRVTKPNVPPYLDNAGVHTMEHLFATYVRNSAWKDNVIYFGPMGCLTGFYFIVQGMCGDAVINLVLHAMDFINTFEGDIPGSGEVECGNYKMHSLEKAKEYADKMLGVLRDWNVDRLEY
jgi:S-ribosylhomocysteine lyase